MKHMAFSLLVAGLLLAAVIATGAAVAHDHYPGPRHAPAAYGWMDYDSMPRGPHGFYGGDPSHLEELDLSTDQKKAIRDILAQTRSKARDLGESLVDNQEEIRDAVSDKGYGPEVEKLAQRQGELIGNMIALRAKTRSQINGVLDEDQKKKLKEHHGERRHYWRGRWDW